MQKQQRKELENNLNKLIDAHLTSIDPKSTVKTKKVIRSSSKSIAKKFSKALKRTTAKKKKAAPKKVKKDRTKK
jgi:hypothetical protein